MTIQELKTLKVGDTINVQNNIDTFASYYIVTDVSENQIILRNSNINTHWFLNLNDDGIELAVKNYVITSRAINTPDNLKRELRLIEAKIKDAEFDYTTVNDNLRTILPIRLQESLPKGIYETVESFYNSNFESLILHENELNQLRKQRNELIEKI